MSKIKTTDRQDEIFDVVNEKDEIIGEATRGQVHSNRKLIHRVVHVWIVNDEKKILLQKRSLTKDKAPGEWDISCGGHVIKGENPESCAKRELREEVGISDTGTELVVKYMENKVDETEMVYLFLARHNGPFKINKDETEKLEFYSAEELNKKLKHPDIKMSHYCKKDIPVILEFLNNNGKY